MRTATKQQTTGKHIGFGKVILFGEHFVVHGTPAIVAGVSEYTDCALRVTPGQPGWRVTDNRPAVPGYKTAKAAEQREAHRLVLAHNKIDVAKDGLEIIIAGPLVPSSGIGASASDCVALTRALSELYAIPMDDHAINHSAFVGEGGYHGTPSGVDNTAATFGGLLLYQRTPAGPQFSRLPCRASLFLVVVSTGITASTTEVVADVRRQKEADPERFAELVRQYGVVYSGAARAVAEGNLPMLGSAMAAAHLLLQQLALSCKELDEIVASAFAAGAIGAKMSGTGRGGIAVALCRDRASQEAVAQRLKESCPSAKFVWQYTVAPVTSSKL